MSVKKYRNIRITAGLAESLEHIAASLDRPSVNGLCEIMLTEYGEMILDPSARRTPKLAVDYDARLKAREPLPDVASVPDITESNTHFQGATATAPEAKEELRTRRRNVG